MPLHQPGRFFLQLSSYTVVNHDTPVPVGLEGPSWRVYWENCKVELFEIPGSRTQPLMSFPKCDGSLVIPSGMVGLLTFSGQYGKFKLIDGPRPSLTENRQQGSTDVSIKEEPDEDSTKATLYNTPVQRRPLPSCRPRPKRSIGDLMKDDEDDEEESRGNVKVKVNSPAQSGIMWF